MQENRFDREVVPSALKVRFSRRLIMEFVKLKNERREEYEASYREASELL